MPDVWDKLHALVDPPPKDTFDPISHTYMRDGVRVPSVSEVLKDAGLQNYSNVPISILENAAARGTAVHKACELLDLENLDVDSVDPVVVPYLLSYQLWREKYRPVYDLVEDSRVLTCGMLDYGGTLDRLGYLNNYDGDDLWVLDIKTSSKKQPFWAIQTAAYDCTQAMRRGAIHCFGTGKMAQLIEYEDDSDYTIWEASLKLWHWKRAKGLGS